MPPQHSFGVSPTFLWCSFNLPLVFIQPSFGVFPLPLDYLLAVTAIPLPFLNLHAAQQSQSSIMLGLQQTHLPTSIPCVNFQSHSSVLMALFIHQSFNQLLHPFHV